MVKLDRCLVNENWHINFKDGDVFHPVKLYSNHIPIVLKLDQRQQNFVSLFKCQLI